MIFTKAMRMNKNIMTDLMYHIYKTKAIIQDISRISRRKLKITEIEYDLKHAKQMCTDSAEFILSKDSISGIELVMLDHVLNSIQDTCYDICECQEIPTELRNELKASLRMIREVFSMDQRW